MTSILPPPLPNQVDALARVLERLTQTRHREPPPLVVFDLDGTLIDSRPRTIRILQEYAEDIRPEVPEISAALEAVSLENMDYLISDTLRMCGVTQADHIRDISHYWRDRYFSDDYLQYDVPHVGAPEYVKLVHESGGNIVYLSGRDNYGMLVGTVASLRDHDFPIGIPGVELVLKVDDTMPEEAWKRVILPALQRSGDVVGYFDNEPANCNIAAAFFPDALVAVLETEKVPGAPLVDEGIEHVADFRLYS